MFIKFNEHLDLFRGNEKNLWCDDAWFDVFSDDTVSALERFEAKDWAELEKVINEKNDSWLYACIYVMGEGINPEKEFDVLITTIMKSNNMAIKERCVDSIRCLLANDCCPTENQYEILKLELHTLSFDGILQDILSEVILKIKNYRLS